MKYIKIPMEVFALKLQLSSKVVYGVLYYMSCLNNPVSVKNDFLADYIGISVDTVKRALKELKDNDYIVISNNGPARLIDVNSQPFFDNLSVIKSEYNNSPKINKPEWLNEYILELENMKPINHR